MNNLNGGVLKCSKLEPPEWMYSPVFTRAMLASAGISCCCVYVCPSVTSRWCTETAKHRITQTTPHDSPGTLVFFVTKTSAKLKRGHPQLRRQMQVGEVKCRCVSWKLATFDAQRCQVSSVASLSHWASTWFVCSTFAVMQRVAQVCQQQLIFVF